MRVTQRVQAGVNAMPWCFLTLGGSELVTGLVAVSPHLIARLNALEITPAMLRTVLALKGRWDLVLRSRPPDFRRRAHSKLR